MAITFKDLVNHPFSFAVGVGVANGLLAVGRGKKIDMPTALTLSAILGLGEMALVMYEPESERSHSLTVIGAYSVLGVLAGVLPFVSKEGHGGGVPIASRESGGEASMPMPLLASNAGAASASAVSGWSRNGNRKPRRAVAPPRRRYA
jgi:hypothetical protein